jgi:hypothetical protein
MTTTPTRKLAPYAGPSRYAGLADSSRLAIYERAQVDLPYGSDHPDAVRGPWRAVLVDRAGYTYRTVDHARNICGDRQIPVDVLVIRSDAPAESCVSPSTLREPGALLFEHSNVDLYDAGPDGAEARWAQARHVALLLNANQDKLDAVAEFRQERSA